jgi:cyclic pyranopterin phosphate synthase
LNASLPLVDTFGRVHTDLRISVTDRCNLRCFYCMPAEGVQFKPHSTILSFEEIERFARLAAEMGICEVRLTGGEPLVRKGVCDLVGMLARVPGITDLAMTTNAILLADCAEDLRAAGLNRLNISLDTLDPEKFHRITRRDELPRVLEGIEAARRAGFSDIKLNALAIRGQVEEDVVPLARFAAERGLALRFIEFMPLDGDDRWSRHQVLSGEEILDILRRAVGPLEPMDPPDARAPATRYRFVGHDGPPIGVIGSVSQPFCDRCGRLRLTADGKIRNCLFATEEWDVRELIRGGAHDREVADLIRRAVWAKKQAHGSDDGRFAKGERTMHQIGG